MKLDPLEYVINCMENAGQSPNPAANGYGKHRRDLLDGIAALRAEVETYKKSAEFWQRECEKLLQALDEITPAAKKWWQVYQDQCEGAYVEATIVKELRAELAARKAG